MMFSGAPDGTIDFGNEMMNFIARANVDGFGEVARMRHCVEVFFYSVDWPRQPVGEADREKKDRSADDRYPKKDDLIDAVECRKQSLRD